MASIGKVAANAVVKATAIILVIRSRLDYTFRAGSMVSSSIGLDGHLNTYRKLLLDVIHGIGKAIQPWEAHQLTAIHPVVHDGRKMLLKQWTAGFNTLCELDQRLSQTRTAPKLLLPCTK